MWKKFFDNGGLCLGRFGSGPHFFLQTITPLLQRAKIGQDQLCVDYFDVADRIDRSADVMNIGVLETAHDLHDRIHLANVAQELIAETFPRARSLDEARDVDELDRRRNNFLRMRKFRERFKSRIGYGDDAEIWIDRAERIIGSLRFACARDRVKERGFPNIRQTHDSSAQHRRGQ